MEQASGVIQNSKQDIYTRLMAVVINLLSQLMTITLAKRVVNVILIIAGLGNSRIAELTGTSDRTVRDLRKKVDSGDTDDLFVVRSGKNKKKSKTDGYEQQILDELDRNNYYNTRQIQQMISDKYSITMSLTAIRNFLHKHGYKRLKCGSLPAKANPVKQREFYETIEHPLMEKAKAGDTVLLFMDAAHFVHGSDFLGCVYTRFRRFIRTYSGRERYNVLGAIDFITKEVVTVTNDTYITATQIVKMLEKLAEKYKGKEIHIILDNAAYQKCNAVKDVAKKLNITLEYIPPYSPNLNLIERFWKFVKGELKKTCFSSFQDFKDGINGIIDSSTGVNKKAVEKLIGEKVQLYDNLQPCAPNTMTAPSTQKTQQKTAP